MGNNPTSKEVVKEYIKNDALIIDSRTKAEFNWGHVEGRGYHFLTKTKKLGAINIPHTKIKSLENLLPKDKEKHIIAYCLSGHRSITVVNYLKEKGYSNVVNGGTYSNVSSLYSKK